MATNILGSAKTFTEYPTFTMAHKHQYLGADVGDTEHLGARSMVTPWWCLATFPWGPGRLLVENLSIMGPPSEVVLFRRANDLSASSWVCLFGGEASWSYFLNNFCSFI